MGGTLYIKEEETKPASLGLCVSEEEKGTGLSLQAAESRSSRGQPALRSSALPTGPGARVQPPGSGTIRATAAGGAAARGALLVRRPRTGSCLRGGQSAHLPDGRSHPPGSATGRSAMHRAGPDL